MCSPLSFLLLTTQINLNVVLLCTIYSSAFRGNSSACLPALFCCVQATRSAGPITAGHCFAFAQQLLVTSVPGPFLLQPLCCSRSQAQRVWGARPLQGLHGGASHTGSAPSR
jgi:hypothetical protein